MSHTRFRGCFVYYEFYIDVFFVVNLVMDFLLLRLVNRVLKGTATPLRSLAGAVLGAAGICVITLLPLSSPYIRVLLSHGVLGILMVWAAAAGHGENCLQGFYCCTVFPFSQEAYLRLCRVAQRKAYLRFVSSPQPLTGFSS